MSTLYERFKIVRFPKQSVYHGQYAIVDTKDNYFVDLEELLDLEETVYLETHSDTSHNFDYCLTSYLERAEKALEVIKSGAVDEQIK